MASLQSSFTVLATTPNPHSRISPFRKPSQLKARRSLVSCSSGSGGGGRVDRRNMLLGLGGLYGASSLVSGRKAEADPLQPPDLSTCDPEGATTTRNGAVINLDVNCCPPYTDKQSNYVLPRVIKPRVRPAAHTLKPGSEYVAKYELAVQMMRDLDTTDPDDPRGFTQQANIHCAYCNGPYDQVGYPGVDLQVHNSWIFFPFHRWYLYFLEKIMGELIGDPTFALPYWNWDNPKGMQMPLIFDNDQSPLWDINRDPAHRPPALVDLNLFDAPDTDPARTIANNLAQMYREMIGSVDSATTFMGQPFHAGDPPPGMGGMGTSEGGSHSGVHVWVGNPANPNRENMGNFYSAGRDPLFYCHHANVDRMWTIWNTIPTDYPKTIDETDFKDAGFMFYDEKKNLVRVRAADCLDYTKMGYKYAPSNTPWMASRPAKRAVPVKIQRLSKKATKADKLFPLTLKKTVRVLVPKPTKGQADEVLVLEKVVTDPTKLIRFDVFINDEDDKPQELDRAEYAGGFTQIPHRARATESASDFRINLKELYENINIADDDYVVVTIVPSINADAVTIGGIKIIPNVAA